jgi:hypothetical protein
LQNAHIQKQRRRERAAARGRSEQGASRGWREKVADGYARRRVKSLPKQERTRIRSKAAPAIA